MSYIRTLALLEQNAKMVASHLNGQLLILLLIVTGYFAAAFPSVASAVYGTFAPALSMALSMALTLLMFLPPLVLAHMFFKHPKTYIALVSAILLFIGKLVSILGNHFQSLVVEWLESHPGVQDFLHQVSARGLGQWIQDLAVRIAEPPHPFSPATPEPPSPVTTVDGDTALSSGFELSEPGSDGSRDLGTGVCGTNSSASDEAELGSRSGIEDSPAASTESSPGETALVTVPRYNLRSPVQVWYSRGSRFRDPETPCPKRAVKTSTATTSTTATSASTSPTTPPIRVRTERLPTPPRFRRRPQAPAEECETLAELVASSIPEPRQESSVVQRYASDNVRPPPGFEGVVPGTPFWAKPDEGWVPRRQSRFAHLW
ncbi:hypothetical protein TWF718_002653 [Orbilia javanica]|uniref:Uncharacterized protein n=1 Tax=Orbilia javanica TaxID=47235 RepID=A0AAN8MS42_9PEZI